MTTLEQIGIVVGFIAFGAICWGIFRLLQERWIRKQHDDDYED